jgi:hypothetical protein
MPRASCCELSNSVGYTPFSRYQVFRMASSMDAITTTASTRGGWRGVVSANSASTSGGPFAQRAMPRLDQTSPLRCCARFRRRLFRLHTGIGFLLPDRDAERYREQLPNCREQVLVGSGHDLRQPSSERTYRSLDQFLSEVDRQN